MNSFRSIGLLSRMKCSLTFISFIREIKVGTYVDNINVDPVTANLWLSHPSPSLVLTIKLGKPSASGIAFPDNEVREVYENDRNELTFSQSAIVYKDGLLVGSTDSNMLYCELKYY